MKIEKLKIGNTYYLPQRGCPTNYTYGVLVEIVSKNTVILENKKGKRFSCNVYKLHKSPDKAVRGRKAQERVRREINESKQREREKLVDKKVQGKVKKLGRSVYATMEKEKYVVRGYKGNKTFTTLEELNNYVDNELKEFKAYQNDIKSRGYKYLCVSCKDGHSEYYTILSISFAKFQISCKHFKGNIEDIMKDKILYRDDVKGLALKIHR